MLSINTYNATAGFFKNYFTVQYTSQEDHYAVYAASALRESYCLSIDIESYQRDLSAC